MNSPKAATGALKGWLSGGLRNRAPRGRPGEDHDEAGFTLIELIITSAILPIVVGGLVVALMTLLTLHQGVRNNVSATSDAQVSTAFFEQDVHNAAFLTTSATATPCGPGTQLLGLESNFNAVTSSFQEVISYASVLQNGSLELVRQVCMSGASTTPTTSIVVISNLPSGQSATVLPAASATAAAQGWVTTVGVTEVSFKVVEPKTGFAFTLSSVPKASAYSASLGGVANVTSTSCGFASPGTGTYASSLCFVDFSAFASASSATGSCPAASGFTGTCYLQPAPKPTGPGCQTITAAIVNTPYTLSFCLSAATTPLSGSAPPAGSVFSSCAGASSAQGVVPSPIPTYNAAPTSESFLGNNGFYAGIPGNPAFYQCIQSGSQTYITLTNIALLDSTGAAASGWQLVTGDAESTDPGESITYTLPSGDPGNSGKVLSDLPDSPSSPYGNACWSNGTGYLTGLGTATVTCSNPSNGWSSDKTGTLILTAPSPTSVAANLTGGGLEAVFFGVLLS